MRFDKAAQSLIATDGVQPATSEKVHIGGSGNRELLTAKDSDALAKDDSAKVKVFKQNNEVIIKNGFECKEGAEFVVE